MQGGMQKISTSAPGPERIEPETQTMQAHRQWARAQMGLHVTAGGSRRASAPAEMLHLEPPRAGVSVIVSEARTLPGRQAHEPLAVRLHAGRVFQGLPRLLVTLEDVVQRDFGRLVEALAELRLVLARLLYIYLCTQPSHHPAVVGWPCLCLNSQSGRKLPVSNTIGHSP